MADIDFANSDSRMNYLKDNLGHLMNGIDKNYGQVLMDELMNRLEQTVSEFNEEVKAMLGQLQGVKTIPRNNIMASKPTPRPQIAAAPAPSPVRAPEPIEELDDFSPLPEVETAPPLEAKPLKEVEIKDDDNLSAFERRLKEMEN